MAEALDREHRFIQMQLVGLLRQASTWMDRVHIADAMAATNLAYKSLQEEAAFHEQAPAQNNERAP